MSRLRNATWGVLFASLALVGCEDDIYHAPPGEEDAGTSGDAGMHHRCELAEDAFSVGDANGHKDPFGAKAAKEARAGRIEDASKIAQPAHGKQRIRNGDFVLANEKIAVVVEDRGLSDGYGRFGGEILAVDRVGDDGKPLGLSYYAETLYGLSIQMVDPTSVSVMNDGSDGGEAVLRVTGRLKGIPFLADGPLSVGFPDRFGWTVAYDYVLVPGEEKLVLRLGVINPTKEIEQFGLDKPGSNELFGFFQASRSQLVTPEFGYEEPRGNVSFAGYDAGPSGFVWRRIGSPMEFGLDISGFQLFWGPGFPAAACSTTWMNQVEIIPGGPHYDGLLEVVRRVDGEMPWRAIEGTVTDADGEPIADAWVHELDAKGAYLSRTKTDADGAFTIHAPDSTVKLVAQKRGYVHEAATVAKDEAETTLAFEPHATIHVLATDDASGDPIPVRVQVIPTVAPEATPESYGVPDEAAGRLHQEFAVTGEAFLPVPPGEHRVIVTRGYEWELVDETFTVLEGETHDVAAALAHGVDSTGLMCADFHLHSYMSPDSSDPTDYKLKGVIADGLEIPFSSEHEWALDAQPIVAKLGLDSWAFSVPSEELTTFAWGHFGVIPLLPKPDRVNGGAIEWLGRKPSEVFADVHAQPEKPLLIVNHPRSGGFMAYFTQSRFDPEKGKGTNELWSDDFDALELTNSSDFEANRTAVIADWFSLLNHGRSVWGVGSSDNHSIRSGPAAYPRTCLFFGHDDPKLLTASKVRDALAKGAATVSGGLIVWPVGPDGEIPGETVKTNGNTATFSVTVDTASWISAETLETIVNGETVATEPLLPFGGGPSKRSLNAVDVTLDPKRERNWVVFHAKGSTNLSPLHAGKMPFGFSNPIFITKK